MKPKKAVKKLTQAEELLSDVSDSYAPRDSVLHAYLDTAIASVTSAKESLDGGASSRSMKKSVSKAAASVKKTNSRATRKPADATRGRHLSRSA